MKRFLKRSARVAADIFFFLTGFWCFASLVFCAGDNRLTAWGTALIFVGIASGGRILLGAKRNIFFQAVLQLTVIGWFVSIRPDMDTVYQTPWAKNAEVTIIEPFVTVKNLRDFHYRTEKDYDVRYRQETYDLREAQELHLAVSHWDGLEKIAHTMLAFSFRDGKRVVLSVETRVPEGKKQGSVAGLFKQFGLGMVWGTESDLLQLRTKFRRETLYLYPTSASPEDTAKIFLALMRKTVERTEQPVFYNTLIRNCTTVLAEPVLPILLAGKIDYRLFLNGFVDELMRDAGLLRVGGEDMNSAKKHYRIPEFLPGGDAEYSENIHKLAR